MGTSGGRWFIAARASLLVSLLVLAIAVAGCSWGGASPSSSAGPATTQEPLLAAFDYEVDHQVTSPTSCPATGVRFTDASLGNPTTWLWTFADGTTSTVRHPVRSVAPSFGEEVTLTVTRGSETSVTTKVISYPEC